MRRLADLFDARDADGGVALLGLILLSAGAWLVFAPLALIIPGVTFLALGLWRLR